MKKKSKLLLRILITLAGAVLTLTGSAQMLLGLAGERVTAVVTSVRREAEEPGDAGSGKYTYRVGYTFYLPDGREISGYAKQIGDAVYLKADGTSTIAVRYFTGFPWLSVPEANTGIRAGQFVFILIGVGLMWLFNSGLGARRRTDSDK
jgi:hypothetical protein